MTATRSPARKIHSGGQTLMNLCESHPPKRHIRAGMTVNQQYTFTYEKFND